MKATHRGTCQVCGRIQAVSRRSWLAKHGYTTDLGFFRGTCSGSDELPIEQDISVTREIQASLTEQATALEALTFDDIKTIEVRLRGRVNGVPNSATFTNAAEYDLWCDANGGRMYNGSWSTQVTNKLRDLHRTAKMMRQHVTQLEALIASRHGQPLYAIEPEAAVERVRHHFNNTRDAYAKAAELNAAGYRTRVSRKWGDITVTGTKAAA